ncbi:MAG: PKD domain-containing protein, partial [Bacteroidota bacterium]|nr:PKD domain-containing protein [Bacteroidota bacterium]
MNTRYTLNTSSLLRWSLSLLLLVLISNAFGQSISIVSSETAICPGGSVTLSYTENSFNSLTPNPCRNNRIDSVIWLNLTTGDTLRIDTHIDNTPTPSLPVSPASTTDYAVRVIGYRNNANGSQCFNYLDSITIEVRNPQASFTWVGPSPNNCANEGPVNFTSNSTGQGLTYAWDFDDGNSSTVRDPNHQYTSIGASSSTYNVTLAVTDDAGCLSTSSQNVTIQQSPNAQF